jgi:hypothetical protein
VTLVVITARRVQMHRLAQHATTGPISTRKRDVQIVVQGAIYVAVVPHVPSAKQVFGLTPIPPCVMR